MMAEIFNQGDYVLPLWTIKVVANNFFESVDSFLLLFYYCFLCADISEAFN